MEIEKKRDLFVKLGFSLIKTNTNFISEDMKGLDTEDKFDTLILANVFYFVSSIEAIIDMYQETPSCHSEEMDRKILQYKEACDVVEKCIN